MARGYKPRRSNKSKRTYKRKGRAVSKVPRNMFTQQSGTAFTISRHYTMCASAAGVLAPVIAMGNINLRGWKSFKFPAAGVDGAAHGDIDTSWPTTIDNIKNVFNNMRVLSHTITLAPICALVDQTAVPVEVVYQRFAVDSGTAVSHCQALTGYGSAAYSKLLMPSDNRMPIVKQSAYPSKTSLGDSETYPIPGSQGQADLALAGAQAGNVNSCRTFGFLKLYAENLGAKQPCYQIIEKITLLASSRKV